MLSRRLSEGDVVVTLGAGDVDRLAERLVADLDGGVDVTRDGRSRDGGDVPDGVERDFPLARLTTIRTGGPADYFARAGSLEQLERLLAWAGEAGLDGRSGRARDRTCWWRMPGVRGLVIKLDRAWPRSSSERTA